MTATVFYDSTAEQAILSVAFTLGGIVTDPTAVSCVVTDPSGQAVIHTYLGASPADIARESTGQYQLAASCSPAVAGADGLWSYTWIATGTVSDVQPGTWRVLPADIGTWYIGLDEFKDRLGITDTADDSQAQIAIQSTAGWVNEYTGRHFFRITETRTFQPHNIWVLNVDDIVPGSAITVNVDMDGDGVFETPFTQNVDYQLRLGDGLYNVNATGITRPYRQLQIIQTGNWFPFTWPYTHLDRVQITTTWGWTAVPPGVTQANFILAADLFKFKDAPFGVAGVSDLGVVRISSNPWLVEMLRAYVNSRRKVGV
jgi:hypothetical protein